MLYHTTAGFVIQGLNTITNSTDIRRNTIPNLNLMLNRTKSFTGITCFLNDETSFTDTTVITRQFYWHDIQDNVLSTDLMAQRHPWHNMFLERRDCIYWHH